MHAAIEEAADHARTEGEPFALGRRRQYIRDRLPNPSLRGPAPGRGLGCPRSGLPSPMSMPNAWSPHLMAGLRPTLPPMPMRGFLTDDDT
ncbi:hypothetical protein ACFYWP_38085 [Actinacidiphila glaucinigra]|uniref:hypothetical protein n=1 Tax=Actinacidiphila glaucinigra TaxID=235986 RepID=UPI0036A0C0F8